MADGKSGLLVNPERPDEVADSIIRILTTPALALSMGEEGRRRADERRWSVVAGEYEAVLREVAYG